MSINPPAGPVPGQPGPPYPAAGPARAHVRRLRQDGGTYRAIAAAAGLDRATVSDLDRGRRQPEPRHHRRRARRDQHEPSRAAASTPAAPGCGCGPCT